LAKKPYGTTSDELAGIGVRFMALLDANKEGWHDKIAKTYVVKAN
jgi:hypothetical protein